MQTIHKHPRVGKRAPLAMVLFVTALTLFSPLPHGPHSAQASQSGPSDVPANLNAGETQQLEAERARLLAQRGSLNAALSAHNQRCSQVRADNTALVRECTGSQANVSSLLSAYRATLAAYEAHRAAVAQAKE
jgi:hypothetical protein